MQTLLTTVVTWLSINAGLPAIYDHPPVEFASPAVMHAVRFRGHTLAHSPGSREAVGHIGRRDKVA